MMKKALAVALILVPSLAWGQGAIRQNGSVVPGDIGVFIQDRTLEGVRKYSADTGKGVNPFAVTDSNGVGICSQNALTTGAYNSICIGHDSSGDPLISIIGGNGGTGGTPHISFGGVTYPLIGSGSANMVGPSPTVTNDVVLWNNTVGTATKGTAGEFAYTTAAGFSMGYGPSAPGGQPGKLTVQNTHTGGAQTTYGIFGHLDFKPINGSGTNPNGIYGDLWYNSPTTFDGLGTAIRGNSYTIPQISTSIGATGSGYTNGDFVTAVGGTCTNGLNTPPVFQLAVSGGVVTAAAYQPGGACGAYPANPIAVTGGSGTGLTLNLSHGNVTVSKLLGVYGRARHTSRGTVTSAIGLLADGAYNTGGGTLTNAIGIWVEPPYDTNWTNSYGIWLNGAFPGGALATAGNDIILNAGNGVGNVSATGPLQAGTSQTCNGRLQGGSNAQLSSLGTNCYLFLNAQSGGQVQITINNLPSAQFNANASAVNYLQVTSAATTFPPSIVANGTDTNIDLSLLGKGTGQLLLGNANSFAANGAVAMSLGSTGPTGATGTPGKYVKIKDNAGAVYVIPAYSCATC
jgi:hypothetical protein